MTTTHWHIGKRIYQAPTLSQPCPFCGTKGAVTELPEPVRLNQPDDTTHVCHPALGGCNQGFAVVGVSK